MVLQTVGMGYTVRNITTYDNENPWWPERRGHWEVVDDAGDVVYSFEWHFNGDKAEWDEREFWQGPRQVRISNDGQWVECVMQTGVEHGFTFPGQTGERVERHPLPPATSA